MNPNDNPKPQTKDSLIKGASAQVANTSDTQNSNIIASDNTIPAHTVLPVEKVVIEAHNETAHSDTLDEDLYDMDDAQLKSNQGFFSRMRESVTNVMDNELLDSFSVDAKRRIVTIGGIIFAVLILCSCSWLTYNFYRPATKTTTTQSKSATASTVAVINDDLQGNFDGIWGDLSKQGVTAQTSTSGSKEAIKIKKNTAPFETKGVQDLVFDTSESLLSNFTIFKQIAYSINSYNISSSNKDGSKFMSKYGWTAGFVSVLSGKYNGNSYQINQVVNRMPAENVYPAMNDQESNFNYVGCKVFDLENEVIVKEGHAKLQKVVCYSSSKYRNSSDGFLIAKYARKTIFGVIEFIGKNDLEFARKVTAEAVLKLD